MRNEAEMMAAILSTAKSDDRIRAVLMCGSRANPNVKKDMFQDYDIIYAVTDTESFISDHRWIDVFGSRIMLQMPELMRNPVGDGRFTYLMLFEDHNRIDLQLLPIPMAAAYVSHDSACLLLLDKDNIFQPLPPPDDSSYFVGKPSELEYGSCCNNFWWCTQNVAKGLYRGELPYVKTMFHSEIIPELHNMLDWYIGTRYDFSISVGKFGKHYKSLLEKRHYEQYARIFSDFSAKASWASLYASCDLFRELAQAVADFLAYRYPAEDDRRMSQYLKWVMNL